jgi:ABC-2 type transport system permease protein
MKLDLSNVRTIARREYLARGRTRTFKGATILLVVVGVGIALAPILIRAIDRGSGPTTIEVAVGDSKPTVDVVAALGGILNAPAADSGGATGPGTPTPGSTPAYRVVATTDVAGATERVRTHASAGLLVLSRDASSDLGFAYVTNDPPIARLPQTIRQAAISIVIQDRLTKAGIPPLDQATLFAPPSFKLEAADPSSRGAAATAEDYFNSFSVGFILSIILFMAIILYGQWIAYSVAEEKSSRVMEVVLGAATPFQLLTGKVLGVGALALTQYAVAFIPAGLALVFQDKLAALVLGGTGTATAALPAGLTLGLILAFGFFFIFGFLLFAVLYAGAAALVSRTEDINQIVAPLTLVSTAGYLIAIWSTTGVIEAQSTLVRVLSFVPFFSPYLMLSRISQGDAGPIEAAIWIAILAVSVPLALWIAARLYSAGVLMYVQRPSIRLLARVLRGA